MKGLDIFPYVGCALIGIVIGLSIAYVLLRAAIRWVVGASLW